MSLINDALKKAQEKRAQEAAAQSPAAPPARAPAPDTISKPPPEDTKKKIPAPPPPADRPQLPIPAPRASTTPRPPIVNYSIPQIDPAEQPATPSGSRPRRSSSIRYDTSIYEEPESESRRSSGTQKKFWLVIGGIAVAAVLVRIIATFGQNDDTAVRHQAEQTPPPQAAVSLPAPSLPPPVLPPRKTEEPPPVVAQPETPAAEPVITASEPPPAISFPAKPAATTKPAPAPAPAPVAAAPAPAAPPTVAMPATTAQPAASTIPSIYAPRAPAPVTNATRAQNFIDRLRVTSVRISDRGSKVILNDRLFSVGELVDPGLELRLIKIEQGIITFSDPEGKKYVKLYQ